MTKLYLTSENSRNHDNAKLYADILRRVFGDTCDVLVVHHITFKRDDEEPNEIPSADTLIFDHEFARAVFGEEHYLDALTMLAVTPTEKRDRLYRELMATTDRIRELPQTAAVEAA